MNPMKNDRRGFTLLEVIVSVAIGAIILAGAMTLYRQGNYYFYKVTEHSSFRTEALMVAEIIENDLEQLQVSTGQWPDFGGGYYLLEPYKLTNADGSGLSTAKMDLFDEDGNIITTEKVRFGQGVVFHRFHHTGTAAGGTDPGDMEAGAPTLVAHRVVYTQEPVDSADPSKGVNLLRNGEKVNHVPLREVVWHEQPLIVAAGQLHGTKSSVLSCSMVPLGGTFGTLATNTDFRVLDRLAKEGSISQRTYHLVGYESFYTAMLVSEIQRRDGGGGAPTIAGMSALHAAVYDHAKGNVDTGTWNEYKADVTSGDSPPSHHFPPDLFEVKNIAFDNASSSADSGWIDSPVQPGKAGSAGEWEIPPGSGSGSSGSETPASGSSSG